MGRCSGRRRRHLQGLRCGDAAGATGRGVGGHSRTWTWHKVEILVVSRLTGPLESFPNPIRRSASHPQRAQACNRFRPSGCPAVAFARGDAASAVPRSTSRSEDTFYGPAFPTLVSGAPASGGRMRSTVRERAGERTAAVIALFPTPFVIPRRRLRLHERPASPSCKDCRRDDPAIHPDVCALQLDWKAHAVIGCPSETRNSEMPRRSREPSQPPRSRAGL